MDSWILIWSWLLAIGLTAFLGLAVVVSIRGFLDIRAMFKSLRERRERGAD
jgi:hypothetical protein